MQSIRTVGLVMLAAGLSACEMAQVKDESSPFYSVPAGSILHLNQEVTIPPDQVAVYVQEGELRNKRLLDFYRPNCKFEVYKISEQARIVRADEFHITRVVDEIETAMLREPVELAVNDGDYLPDGLVAGQGTVYPLQVLAFAGLDQSEVYSYSTVMYLSSDSQPDVFRLSCQHWESILDDRFLSIEQMRAALGKVFTLIIK